MKFDRGTVVAISFVFLSGGSAIYVSVASLNYLLLYPTLNEIDRQQPFQLDSLSLTSGSSNISSLVAQVTVRNPTAYSGLRVSHIQMLVSFHAQTNKTDKLFSGSDILKLESTGGQLGANSADSITSQVQLSLNQSRLMTSFVNRYQGQVIADVQLRVDLATFLVSVTGTEIFTRTQEILLTTG